MANNINKTKVITGVNTRLSYFHGWEPVSINGGAEKYSVSFLIPKDDKETINAVNTAIDAAIEEGIAKFGGKKPNKATIILPLRDGDLERDSVKKYTAMENAVCHDYRIRGMFTFLGANRTGRFSSKIVQLQNLPQNHMPDLKEARGIVKSGDYETLEMLCEDIPDTLSQLIRTAFVPKVGNKFIVADFSAIEARVLSWLAGEEWRTEVFASGGDIYCASASQMFKVPVEKHGVNGHLRQKGKIAELALGYGGSVGALKAMGALEMGLEEEELKPLLMPGEQPIQTL